MYLYHMGTGYYEENVAVVWDTADVSCADPLLVSVNKAS